MEPFLFDDIGSMIQNKAIERIISPMTVQLCHLLISMERKDLKDKVFASLQKMAEELDEASEEFVQVANRLAEDSEEEWLREEMKPVTESLFLSGRNITLVAQKLHLQPESQCHQEELVTTAQQILVDTTKVLLLEDAAMARKTVRAAGWCLTCLDQLEAVGDASSLSCPLADLAEALLHLGHLTACGPEGRLGRESRLLRGCIPTLFAAARGHLRHPRDPQLAISRRHVFALTRKILRGVLDRLEPVAAAPARTQNGAFTRRLWQLRELLATRAPLRLADSLLDAPLAPVLWHCLRLAACSAPPERLLLVAHCRQLLELRCAGVRRLDAIEEPLVTSQRTLEPGEECSAMQAATEALSQGVRAGLLHQILDTFTDTHSPLQRLAQASVATSPIGSLWDDEVLSKSLQLFLAAFCDQANQMLQVAHLVLVCCPRQQTGREVEAAMVGLWRLVVRVQQLFSQTPQGSGLDWSPTNLQALLQAWARASERLLACFDDVLSIPEFLNVSIQEMMKHLDFLAWALRTGDSREFSRHMAYLQGRATHIVQVMSRYVDQDRDPIFRNGLRVLIQELEQSSLALGVAAVQSSSRYRSQEADAFLAMAKHLIYSAQQVREGLDGTNHPDILSPLRGQVQRSSITKGWRYFILPSLQDSRAPEMKFQKVPGLGEIGPGTSFLPMEQPSCPLISDTHPQQRGSPLPATSKLTLAVGSQDHQVVASMCTNMPEWDAAVDAAQEALNGEEALQSERMTGLQEISTLTPSVINLAREKIHSTTSRNNNLLEVAFQLSGRTEKNKQGLVTMAGDWYPLCQQLFGHNPTADLPESMAVFMELQQNLASMVQLVAKSGPMCLDKKDPDSTRHQEVLQQMQGRLEEVKIHAKQLLDKVLASVGLQAPKLWEEHIENGCLLWSVAVQDLIQNMEKLSRRKGLFLLPLRQAVKDQQGLQKGLDHVAHVFQRLQEAARLSRLLCGDEQVKGEVSFLCREVHVLRDALTDVAHILVSSPKPSPSLSTRFELLCLELTLRIKALTGYLSSINADYEHAFQDAVYPMLSFYQNQTRTENSLERMVSGIKAVQRLITKGQKPGPCQKDLLAALESILILTKEVAQRVPVLQEHTEEWELYVLDWLQWEWAAKSHHAVAQLQAWQGVHTKAWRLLDQCLKPREESARAPEQNLVQPQFHYEEGTAEATEGDNVGSQGIAPRGTPESSVGTCTAEPAITRTTTADVGMKQNVSPFLSPGCPATPHTEKDQHLSEDGSRERENRITQITQEMAKEVLLMAQSLRKKGHILTWLGVCPAHPRKPYYTKDQLITSARKIATSGQNFARLTCIIAKNCIDERCSQELLCVVEQIQTLCSQLHIISSVKASLARSKSSEELLVGNAQQLLQAVSKTVRAAEAASLRGLRPPSTDPEELEVAAFCMQWRQKLLRHRLQETSDADCDALGLRKTSTNPLPAFPALVQEVS